MSLRFSSRCGRRAQCLIVALAFCCGVAAKEVPVQHLRPLPAGVTLPVILETTLNRKNVHPAQPVVAKFSQRVPIGEGLYLPEKTVLEGSIASYDGKTLTIVLNRLRLRGETLPVSVRLLAVASWNDVYQTKLPLGATDRGTSSWADWTTMQIGRDEVYRSGGVGLVYNQYSQPVGNADFYGVYARSSSPALPPRALGPFSTTAAGLYDVPGLSIAPAEGSKAIAFRIQDRDWQLHTGDALLLEVTD